MVLCTNDIDWNPIWIHWIHENMECLLVNSKVDGRKFNKVGVRKAEHEKVRLTKLFHWFLPFLILT